MENKPNEKEKKGEEKVGVIPASQLTGSDADQAYPDQGEKQEKQEPKSDAEPDQNR